MASIARLFNATENTGSSPAPPTLESVSPRYASLIAKRAQLTAEVDRLTAEGSRLQRLVYNAKDAPAVTDRARRVAELAGRTVPASRQGDRDRLADVTVDLDDAKEALRLVEVDLFAAHAEASRLLCDTLQPQSRALVRRMAKAAIEFHDAWREQDAFLDELHARGVALASLRPERPTWAGRHSKVRDGDLSIWLRDLVKAGHLSKDEIPEGHR